MRTFFVLSKGAIFSLFAFLFWGCQSETNDDRLKKAFQIKFEADIQNCKESLELLQTQNERDSLIFYFKKSRLAFKQCEPVLSFYASSTYQALNQVNLPKIDEDDNAEKVINAKGYQVIEELLVEEHLPVKDIRKQITNMITSLDLLKKLQPLQKFQKHHILWLSRNELLRISSLGISGFDSPILLNSLDENKQALESLRDYMHLSEVLFSEKELLSQWDKQLRAASDMITSYENFNDFDRYHFIRDHIHSLLATWVLICEDWNIEFPFEQKIDYKTTSFFSPNTFVVKQFAPAYSSESNKELIALGKDLFHDKRFSKDGKMSCASCHQVDKAFTDGRQFAQTNSGGNTKRNAPTVLYTALQNAQFYDARSGGLEEQISAVIKNKDEFHNQIKNIVEVTKKRSEYVNRFKQNYKEGVTAKTVRNAIATYERSLLPFNSSFDQNISKQANNLSQDAITGFNLFMGKAKCGTCHFAPVFNGTIPPNFSHTELEVIGVPQSVKWENAEVDKDLGRFDIFPVEQRKHAFKTPTVRNAKLTAPYMHNGVYQTLDDVIKFYNLGGGAGIGIDLPNQTLPPDSLGLSTQESEQIIAFLHSLTDSLNSY
ncbi:cytochrome-c peroxidase [Sediminitomix flava]|uniref:Cytochrome c peroxidase n=1 Tax=Sediminitomix flava TaxID=379075 RepID=A0A315ZGL2_SEDFL|nr:cytochrome c peroxidase [Sediminitomix flava]PWJ44726.1 cytochrome c peroxidase [Sediminitomix flava]